MKPTVKYSEFVSIHVADHPELGLIFWAYIRGVKRHHKLGNQMSVTTSRLVTLPDSKGRFETLNTIYEMEE